MPNNLIESIWAKNLQCFDEIEHRINCAPLTIIVGPNNSGKSAIITAFNLLRDAGLRSFPQWTTESYNLGDFASAVHEHETARAIELGTTISQESYLFNFSGVISQGGFTGIRYNVPEGWTRGHAPNILRTAWYFRASRNDITRERQTGQVGQTPIWGQPLDPYGSNIITYLLERWTDQDDNWTVAQEWLRRIDPELSILKSPLRGNMASIETKNKYNDVNVNIAYQGTGIQKALTIVAGVIFSPPDTTIIIEEPEVHLERHSIEVLVDLFNYAVTHWKKQIILSTHSIDLLLQYASDLGLATKRGREHIPIDPSSFKLISFQRKEGKITIEEEDMKGRFTSVMDRLRGILKTEPPIKVPITAS